MDITNKLKNATVSNDIVAFYMILVQSYFDKRNTATPNGVVVFYMILVQLNVWIVIQWVRYQRFTSALLSKGTIVTLLRPISTP